jgi:hypothetical protein
MEKVWEIKMASGGTLEYERTGRSPDGTRPAVPQGERAAQEPYVRRQARGAMGSPAAAGGGLGGGSPAGPGQDRPASSGILLRSSVVGCEPATSHAGHATPCPHAKANPRPHLSLTPWPQALSSTRYSGELIGSRRQISTTTSDTVI